MQIRHRTRSGKSASQNQAARMNKEHDRKPKSDGRTGAEDEEREEQWLEGVIDSMQKGTRGERGTSQQPELKATAAAAERRTTRSSSGDQQNTTHTEAEKPQPKDQLQQEEEGHKRSTTCSTTQTTRHAPAKKARVRIPVLEGVLSEANRRRAPTEHPHRRSC